VLLNPERGPAIAVNHAAHNHAAVPGCVKGKPGFARCFAPLTHPARGGIGHERRSREGALGFAQCDDTKTRMAGTEEWFRPDKEISAGGSDDGKRDACGGLRPVVLRQSPAPMYRGPEGREERLGAAQSDGYLRLARAQSDDN
jgi:hypothetical protein